MVGQSGPLQHGAPPLVINRYRLDLLLEGDGAHREPPNSVVTGDKTHNLLGVSHRERRLTAALIT